MRAGTKEWYAYHAGRAIERHEYSMQRYAITENPMWLKLATDHLKRGLSDLAKSDERFQSFERFDWINRWFGAS